MWKLVLYKLINYVKRKLKRAKPTNEIKCTKDTNEWAKVITKQDYLKNKDVRLDENAKYRKQRRRNITLRYRIK